MKLDPSRPPSDDDYFMGIALAVRRKANCTGNRVAAIIVKDKRVIATGYNGTPSGMKNCLDGGCFRCTNPDGQFTSGQGYDLCICVHAEQNALLAAARFGIAVEGADIYSTMQPCFGCTKEIVQAKIQRIVYLHPWIPTNKDPKIDEALKAEYQKIMGTIALKQLSDFEDPVEEWAISTKRKMLPVR